MIETGCGYATDERQKYCDWTWWRAADKEARVGDEGERLVLAPGGAMLIRSARNRGLQGLGLPVRRGLPRGVSEVTGHTERMDDALIEYGFHACAS